jgi:toxin YoeB
MIVSWVEKAWEDYLYWQSTDKKTVQRINALIQDASRHPFTGIGDPEALKHNWAGYWSRRIDREHRFIYKYHNETITIVQCRYHYQV